MSDGQFDWGGRLLKSNGGVQRKVSSARTEMRKSAKAEGSLTERLTSRPDTKVGLSDPAVVSGNARSTDKSYPGDNRLISPKSSHRRGGLAPRCRLIASWSGSTFQGLGCSPIKAVRELGSERRETVRSLSVAGVRYLKSAVLSTRTRMDIPMVYQLSHQRHGWVAKYGLDKRWKHLSVKPTLR